MSSVPSYITMFPEPADVFADRMEEHSKFLFPLFSVDLSQVNPSWQGKLHMLQFNEDPYNRETVSAFNEYCTDRTIGFDVIDGKYSFKTDFKFFELSPGWVMYYNRTRDSFEETKKRYADAGIFTTPYNYPEEPFNGIGGEAHWTQSAATPLDPDGNPMTFIAQVYTAKYCKDSCEKDLFLFYSHDHQLAVITYQIT